MGSEDTMKDEQGSAEVPSPGKRLKDAREQLGLSQQALADKLFLKLSQIDDIESDRLDDKTSITFAKGYVRLYAKHVGVNETLILEEFDTLHNAPKPPAKLQSFSKRVAKEAHDDRWMMVTYGILFLLVAGIVVWWYQQANETSLSDQATSPVAGTEVTPSVDSDDSSTEVTDTFEPAADDSPAVEQQSSGSTLNENDGIDSAQPSIPSTQPGGEAPSVEAQMPDERGSATNAIETADDADEEVAEPAQQTVEQPADEDTDTTPAPLAGDVTLTSVTFTFDADCWVNIEDATGEAIAYGVKQAGRVMTIEGVAPFEVTLGAPDVVSIEFGGQPVDISSFQNGRTARFSLPLQE